MLKLNQQQLQVGEIWAAWNSVMGNHDARHRQLEVAREIPHQLSATSIGQLQSRLLRPPVIKEGNMAQGAWHLSGMERDTVPLTQQEYAQLVTIRPFIKAWLKLYRDHQIVES